MVIDKKVRLRLVGVDGNAFSLLGAFRRAASREGWTEAEIKKVTDRAMMGDYDNLVATLAAHCEGGGFGSDDFEEDDE